MQITEDIIELAKKAHFTTVELYELAHSYEVTHPENAEGMLREALKKGRRAEPYGKRYHELVAARHRLLGVVAMLGGASNELQTIQRLIGELEPKALEAAAKRLETKREDSAARRARGGQ